MGIKDVLKKSGSNVLDTRAQNIYNQLKIEEERHILDCRSKVSRLEAELAQHRDLSITDTTSLEVAKNIDASKWIEKRHKLALELEMAKLELECAIKVDREEFPKDAIKGEEFHLVGHE